MTKRPGGAGAARPSAPGPGFLPLAMLLAASLLVAALPLANAHGAAPQREVDTRVLLDHDGALAYGGCLPGAPSPPSCSEDAGAVDLLSLDAREARNDRGEPFLVLRVTAQAATDTLPGRSITLSLTAAGTPLTVLLQGDGSAWNASGILVAAPQPVGDGHPKAIDVWVPYTMLGAGPGATLTGITAASAIGTSKGDLMPGTWYGAHTQQSPVPFVPEAEPGATGPAAAATVPPAPGTYTLRGPAPLLQAGADLLQAVAGRAISVSVTNPLNATPQFVLAVASGNSTVDPAAFNLMPGATRTLQVVVRGNGTLRLATDLGGYVQLNFTALHHACTDCTVILRDPQDADPALTQASSGTSRGTPAAGLSGPLGALMASLAIAAARRSEENT